MSFDVFVQDLPRDARTVADISRQFVPQAIGRRADIVATILKVAPQANFSDPEWGTIECSNGSIEVNISSDDPVESFAFHVRGGQEALFVIAAILSELQLRALAPGTESGFFELNELDAAFRRWNEYRRQVIEKK